MGHTEVSIGLNIGDGMEKGRGKGQQGRKTDSIQGGSREIALGSQDHRKRSKNLGKHISKCKAKYSLEYADP